MDESNDQKREGLVNSFFAGDPRAEVTVAYNKILLAVRDKMDDQVEVKLFVEKRAHEPLRQRLISAGFLSVEFLGEPRGLHTIVIKGNPYARNNAANAAQYYISKIRTLLKTKRDEVLGKVVSLSLHVPEPARGFVKDALTKKEFLDVLFEQDPGNNSIVKLVTR